jgi:glycine hydroxymethyltransferase
MFNHDKEIRRAIKAEYKRQNKGIELIASENYPSHEILKTCGSILTDKYAEGYPDHRYYGGCENIDTVEQLAINRACVLFKCKFANVQPHSGSQANYAAYHAMLEPGQKILSLVLNDGGHLTHGSKVSFSANEYNFVFYPLDETGHIDYKKIEEIMDRENPDMFLAGYSAYPFEINFKLMREIINRHNAKAPNHCWFMVDMAHIAGIVAAKLCQNPCDYADIVTSTTHKTLRGPRGGIILTNNENIAKRVNQSVFPYTQGGPLEHIIAAKAVCFREAATPEFKTYMVNVLCNTRMAASTIRTLGGFASSTDNHLFLLNTLKTFNMTGADAQAYLEKIGITTNKNMLHNDTLSPAKTSGLRIGFAAATTRGCTEEDAIEIAKLIYTYLKEISIAPANTQRLYRPYRRKVKKIIRHWHKIAR